MMDIDAETKFIQQFVDKAHHTAINMSVSALNDCRGIITRQELKRSLR